MGVVTELVIKDRAKQQIAKRINPAQRTWGQGNLVYEELYPRLLPPPRRMVESGGMSTLHATFPSAYTAPFISLGNAGHVTEDYRVEAI